MTPSQIKKVIDCLSELKTEKQLLLVDEDFEDIGSDLETDEIVEDQNPDLDIAKEVISVKKETI